MSDEPQVNKTSWGLIFNVTAFVLLILILFLPASTGIDRPIAVVIGVLCLASIKAIFVRIATRVWMKFNPSYSMAWKACATAFFLACPVVLLLKSILANQLDPANQLDADVDSNLLGFIASLIVAIPVYGKMVSHPVAGPIGLLNGLVVALVSYLLVMLLVVIPFVLASWFIFVDSTT